MAKKISNKKPMFGNNRPFSLKTSLKIQKPNMQKVTINGETVVMKVEIQIRTIAMDFWAEMEHDIRYKSKNNISLFDSKKLTWYAKILEKLQGKIVKIYRKQETNTMFNY